MTIKPIKKLIAWCSEDQAFHGFVLEGNTMVTCCLIETRKGVEAWLDDAVARRAWEDGSELPDMYDRQQGAVQ